MEIRERTDRRPWQVNAGIFKEPRDFLHVTKYYCADPTKGILNGRGM